MVESSNLNIRAMSVEGRQGHQLDSRQNSESNCSLFFNGTEVIFHRTEGIRLNIDDSKAMRDFLNAAIKEMEEKENQL